MIYFVQQGKAGPIKIGYTARDDIKQRLSALQVASIDPLNVLGVMSGSEEQEKAIHRFFHAYRIRGEWFKPHPKILMYIMGFILGKPISDPSEPESPLHKIEDHVIDMGLDDYLRTQEINIITRALENTRWNITEAAKQLSLSFRQIRHRIYKYNIKLNNHNEVE